MNVNFLSAKIESLREILLKAPIEILCVDETKLDSSFPEAQFKIENYQYPPFRRDRNSKGGGKIVFVRKGIISKQLSEFETKTAETICIELTISNKKWCILFCYRPPKFNKNAFFEEIATSLNKISNKYENILLAGDLNIDFEENNAVSNHLSDLSDMFNFQNLVKEKTCFKSEKGTLIDLFLTNKPRSFQKTQNFVTGISDCHKLIITVLRASFKKLPPKVVVYRNYKDFNEKSFLSDLDRKLIRGNIYKNCQNKYSKLTNIFQEVLNHHAPLKQKKIRGNHTPFMTKELSKAIMNKSKAKNKYIKWPSRENFMNLKRVKNKCNSINKKAKRQYFKNATKEGVMNNKKFWNTVKPFLTNKGVFSEDHINIRLENDVINDEKQLVELFNDHYINIVQKTANKKISSLGDSSNPELDEITVAEIIEKYKSHPSVLAIKNSFYPNKLFDLPKPNAEDINKIIKSLNTKKATGPDRISAKLVQLSANVIDCHLSNIIAEDISLNRYSENSKTASVRPIYKKDDRTKIKNYRPVSLLNIFSKVYEKFIHNSLVEYVDTFLSNFISAYRESYSSNHVLIRLIESWKKSLDQNKYVGAVLMDLSKAFDCIPHDLLIAKMHGYGFSHESLTFFYSYLKRRKQNVKIGNTYSVFQILLSGVPQGSILGPILFNIFINDIYLFMEKSDLHNFADDNTIASAEDTLSALIEKLEAESQTAINWFKNNEMIVNPDKFQAIIINKNRNMDNEYSLNIGDSTITSAKSVTLLGIEIDNKLSFEDHVSYLCRKANNQLNAISRLKRYMGTNEKEILINSFVYANFNYCPLVWHFCPAKSLRKLEKVQERALRILFDDFDSEYESLLKKSGKCTMEIKRLRTLGIEIFKTLNDLNPQFMKDVFQRTKWLTHKPLNLKVNSHNTVKYGDKSLATLGPHIWNSLPDKVKIETDLSSFKKYINQWFGPTCKCNLCSFKR